jgi:zinc protease
MKQVGLSLVIFLLFILPGGRSLGMPGSPVRVFYLDNGLQVIMKEQHQKNLIALNAYVKGGSRTETPDISGLSHYYEHLIFRGGTDRQEELETRKAFQSLGTFYGFTSDDVTDYYIVTTKENLEEGLWRHADVVMNTKITQKKVDQERQVVMEEYNMNWDRPDYRVYYLMLETAYKVHPYRVSPIGSKEVILNSNLDRFRTFYKERYVPNQMVLACVGDFDTQAMLKKIKNLWGKYPRGRDSFELGLVEPEQAQFREAALEMEAANSYMLWAFHIPEAAHSDLPVLDVLNNILSDGENSRLYQALKVEENLVLSATSYVDKRKDPGLLVLDLLLEPENEIGVVQTIFNELKQIAEEGVTAEELAAAKKKIENHYYFEHQSFINQAQTLCFYAANADISLESSYLEQIRKTSVDDIIRVVRKYLRSTNCSIATVRPEGAASKSFAAIAEEVVFPPLGKEASAAVAATKKVLSNGLTLISKPDFSSNTIAMEVYIKGGLLAEDESNNGVCNFISRSLLKGTANRNAARIAGQIDNLGIKLEASSQEDYSEVSLLTVPDNFQPAADLLVEVLTSPSPTAAMI